MTGSARSPSFSIVIPTYNRPDRLDSCLRAVAELRYDPERLEVLVVDDGTEQIDRVRAVLDDHGGRLRVELLEQTHRGPAAARNLGASRATGRFLAFTDDDCRVDPGWLRALEVHLESTPRGIVGGRTVNALVDNVCAEASQALVSYLYGYYERRGNPFIASNNIALARDLFGRLGGFDERFPLAGGEDREFCDRAARSGCDLILVRDAVVNHHHALSFASFVRQHVHYGRGACHFHQIRAGRAGGRIRLEPPSFYVDLVRYPLTAREVRHRVRACLLMLVSQVANAGGFFAERLRRKGVGRRRSNGAR